ncbi:glycerate kinase [Ruania alba]|uniref:Glycerate kinase n=1 Tax=Ruania alba TaxID=648782 RepID=A0A1H5H6X2_9MICO|nr:glycerate kinase [Ruania alba]SEE23615.1 glycerate kinase [Ruania alba]
MTGSLRILIAVDKFKGCLTGTQVAGYLGAGIRDVRPDTEVRVHPVSDGGDGFASELVPYGFAFHRVSTRDPLGRPVAAGFVMRGGCAVLEMALASGLELIHPAEREPLVAHTYGLGEVLRAAADQCPRRIIVGAGGSATSDGGAGALAALGAQVYDRDGNAMTDFGPSALMSVARVDLSGLQRWRGIELQIATDVTNPLLGGAGAAAIFGPQKGAGAADIACIERALSRWADVLEHAAGRAGRCRPGAGAAGGLGFGLHVGLGADIVDGLTVFSRLSRLEEAVGWSDVVITGEGSLDPQTTSGKAPSGVLRYARQLGRPCWVVAGRSELDATQVRDQGYAGHRTLMDLAPDEGSSITCAGRWLQAVGRDLASHALPDAEPTATQDSGASVDDVRLPSSR